MLYWGGAALLLGLFIKFSSELREGDLTACDLTILN
jgi:hypothetical protein